MLTSASLQLIAMITMLIDHIGAFLCGNDFGMRLIGRLAMPLFCFMLSEGFLHTKGRRWQYFGRLALFAFISQLPYDLLRNSSDSFVYLNVMFTLATGFAAMALIEYGGWSVICLPIIFILAEYLHMDYGAYGIAMIVGFYLVSKFLKKKKYQLWRWLAYVVLFFTSTTIYVAAKHNYNQLFAMMAIIPIILYNGKLGRRLPKWFGYIFYPAHLLVIFVVQQLFLH
ncbi:MAG: conjugal transfer protein TraX [Candidatus Saccharibacteria bacterium]|nr:conjugal transfer protein TraX [Candidatus Saccharibacteria bacterium]